MLLPALSGSAEASVGWAERLAQGDSTLIGECEGRAQPEHPQWETWNGEHVSGKASRKL